MWVSNVVEEGIGSVVKLLYIYVLVLTIDIHDITKPRFYCHIYNTKYNREDVLEIICKSWCRLGNSRQ